MLPAYSDSAGNPIRSFFGASLVTTLLLAPMAFAQQQHLFTMRGAGTGDNMGWAVSDAGDVDRDGHTDVIIGSPTADPNGAESGMVQVFSGRNGKLLHTFIGDSPGDQFGKAVSGVGDLNGDRYDDVIVGAPLDDNTGTDSGSARVFSGRDGKVLFTFNGNFSYDYFGFSVSEAGDMNGDQFPDFMVGAHLEDNIGPDYGSVIVFSGKWALTRLGQKVLYKFFGDDVGDIFGAFTAAAGDVNGDGFDDIIVGAAQRQAWPAAPGYARVLSGKDGKTLYTFKGTAAGDLFGYCVGNAGDVDRDGRPDLMVGAVYAQSTGTAQVFSGRDGRVLYSLKGNSVGDQFGQAVTGIGDANRDGRSDFLVSAPLSDIGGTNAGSVFVFSGLDGKALFSFHGQKPGEILGVSATGAGDVNTDGFTDIIAGAPEVGGGRATVFSGVEMDLATDVHELTLKSPNSQRLSLSVGSFYANRLYWIFGSASGTVPGITFPGLHIPLNPDLYTELTLALAGSSLMANFKGTLDAQAKAVASFNIPAGLPALLGFEVDHAFIIFDGRGNLFKASNTVSLRFVNR